MSPHGKECLEYEQNERANPAGNCEKLLQCKDCKTVLTATQPTADTLVSNATGTKLAKNPIGPRA